MQQHGFLGGGGAAYQGSGAGYGGGGDAWRPPAQQWQQAQNGVGLGDKDGGVLAAPTWEGQQDGGGGGGGQKRDRDGY